MGFLAYDVAPGHPKFSQITPCPTCSQGAQRAYLERICGLPAELRNITFALPPMLGQGDAFQTLRSLAADPRRFVTLHGAHGAGKTHLLAALVNEGRALGWPSVYTTMADLLDHLRATFNTQVSYDGLWQTYQTCRVLALDEFDRWSPTEWAQEKFFQLIESRYERGADLLTAFATNADLDALPSYVVSRMRDRRCLIFELSGPDLRKTRR